MFVSALEKLRACREMKFISIKFVIPKSVKFNCSQIYGKTKTISSISNTWCIRSTFVGLDKHKL